MSEDRKSSNRRRKYSLSTYAEVDHFYAEKEKLNIIILDPGNEVHSSVLKAARGHYQIVLCTNLVIL
ncbi:hypothetical protein PGB90_007943 [Kerria lacca]